MIGIYLDCMKRWLDFSSRAPRREYGFFALANFLISISINIVLVRSGYLQELEQSPVPEQFEPGPAVIAISLALTIYYIWQAVAGLACTVRRMRDLNWPLWYLLGFLVPILNIVMALMLFFKKSQPIPEGTQPLQKAG